MNEKDSPIEEGEIKQESEILEEMKSLLTKVKEVNTNFKG